MSNRYKQYFDNISPDKKLTEETAQKMLEELNATRVKKFNIKPFAAAAACVAVTAATLILAPDMKKDISVNESAVTSRGAVELPYEEPVVTTVTVSETTVSELVSESTVSSVNAVTSNPPVTTAVSASAVSSPGTTTVSSKTTVSAAASSASAQITVQTSASSYQHSQSQSVSSVSSATSQTTEAPKTTKASSETSKPVITKITSSAAESAATVTSAVVSEDKPVTSVTYNTQITNNSKPVLRPGITDNIADKTETNNQITTTPSDEVFYETVEADGISVKLNYAYEYDYLYPSLIQKADIQSVSEILGDFMPGALAVEFNNVSGVYVRNDRQYSNGICFTFGEETELDRTSGKFISMAVGKNEPQIGYNFSFIDSVKTELGDSSVIIGTSGEYTNVYFCSINKNGLCYKFLFKGYSLDETLKILKTV